MTRAGIGEASHRPGRERPQLSRVVASLSWLTRGVVFAAVGVFTFAAASSAPRRDLDVEFAAYTVSVLAGAAWAVLSLSRRTTAPTRRRGLPAVLVVLTTVPAATFTAPHAGPLLALAFMAALAAGSELVPAAGVTVTVAGILALEVGALLRGTTSSAVLLLDPAMFVVALLAGLNRRSYRIRAEQSAALLAQVEQLRSEQNRVAVLDERTRIAREIHDVLAHSLGALGIQLQAARAVLADRGDVDTAVGLIDAARRTAGDGLVEARRAVHALRTGVRPLDEELAGITAAHRADHGVAVTLALVGDRRPLSAEVTVALLRVAREALVNAARHAPGVLVDVQLRYGRDITLVVANDVAPSVHPDTPDAVDHGARGAAAGGYGLIGMRERLLLIGGTLAARREGTMWIVTAQVPLGRADDATAGPVVR